MENQGLCKCNKRKKMICGDGDLISGLPDEILESILSRLTMKEAACTSVLDHRWQYLWEFRTGSMNFDFGKEIWRRMYSSSNYKMLEEERARYTSRVNNIINRHRGNSIEEFRVAFDLNDYPQIDSWIEFALNKRVQRLELQLNPVQSSQFQEFYPLPPLGSRFDISCLRSLRLHCVNVSGEQFEYILSNCKLLEYLAIAVSWTPMKSTVVTPCPMLKHLELHCCTDVEDIDIYSAPNLTTFVCTTEGMFHFRNVPKLSQVSLSGFYCNSIIERFHDLPIPLSQLQKLTLMVISGKIPEFSSVPELKNLKELELILLIRKKSVFSYTKLMKACPNLKRLMMEFRWRYFPVEEEVAVPSHTKGGIYKNLKDLELIRFRGDPLDLELVTYVLCNSPNIENIKVCTHSPCIFDTHEEEEDVPKDFVTYLAQELAPSAQLLIDES